jgi:NADH:ubiquinone oxidoreductase subunit D
VGIIPKEDVLDLGLSGVIARASGLPGDLRKTQPYEIYSEVVFKVPVATKGDCFQRYLIRTEEMRQSTQIIYQALNLVTIGPVRTLDGAVVAPTRKELKSSMEKLINHFRFYSSGFLVPKNELYVGVEAPKGEFGVYLVSSGSSKPYRCKIKSPGFLHLQALDYIVRNHLLADVVTILGSLDIVFGEVDR